MRRLPLVAVLVGVALAVILWQHVPRNHAVHPVHVVHVVHDYPLFSTSACAKPQTFTWYDMPAPGGGYQPILCGNVPPSDTGSWGADLPEGSPPIPLPATTPPVKPRAAAKGCPANYCSPNPNPAVPSQRTGLP